MSLNRILARWIIAVCSLLSAPVMAASVEAEAPEGNGPTKVYCRVFVVDVDEVDTANQNFTANVYFDARWHDARLAHSSSDSVMRPLTDVWHPWLQVVNRQKIWPSLPEMVEIEPSGGVVYRQRVWGQFSQPLRLGDFPFDEHTFSIILTSVRSRGDDIALLQNPEVETGIAEELSLPDFKVTDHRLVVEPYRPTPDSVSAPAIRFEFDGVRESGYYVVKVMVPLVLIVAMSWIVFWIDPKEAGTQIGLGATAMLTLIANRFVIDGSLPKVAYLTRMDVFILASTVLVFASLIEVVLTSYLARHDRLPTARRIDRVMRIAFPALFAVLTLKAFVW